MTDQLAAAVRAGDRRALARAITLVESTRTDHRSEAARLLDALLDATGGATRLAVTGAPGAGKSTLTEALGIELVEGGNHVAVLAIDPSSQRSGGSILGDKTRMEGLARRSEAFIRPSPSGGTLGGVARRTREALLLCEAAGFSVVMIETVGVGQSETAAAAIVDCTLLVVAPGGGDELQGIKRGIMELADIVVVNKADGDLRPAADRAKSDIRAALHLMEPRVPGWKVPVLTASALDGQGVDELWQAIQAFQEHVDATVGRARLRGAQAVHWMRDEVRGALFDEFERRPGTARRRAALEAEVRAGTISPTTAAQQLLSGTGEG